MGYIGIEHQLVHQSGNQYLCEICRNTFTIDRDWQAPEEIRNTPLPNGVYFELFNPKSWLMESEASDYIKQGSILCSLRSLYKL